MYLKIHYYRRQFLSKVSKQTLKIMKLIAIILFAACIQVSARGYSQITLSETNAPLQKVFQKIQQQSGYDFVSTFETLKEAGNVTVNVRNVSLQKALEECLKGKPLTFMIISKTVVIKLKENYYYNASSNTIAFVPMPLPLPPIEIHGQVKDENGNPLANASVMVKGTNQGVTTNQNGDFAINVTGDNAVLVISFTGYDDQEIVVGARTRFVVDLQKVNSALNTVVVTALGIQRSVKSLTYSTQNVNTASLTQARSLNLVGGLEGKIAGLTITTGSTGVGSADKVLLRGDRSISRSSEPLYVVDGIIINGDISNLSPDDIESISVLKGPNAAALYGSMASNGAIIVTTKSGKDAPNGVSSAINFNFVGNDPIFLLKFQNEYGQGSDEIYSPKAVTSWGPKMDGSQVAIWSNDPNYIANQLGGKTTYPYTAQPNNVKDFFQLGTSLATNLSTNIKSEKSNFFMGYTYTNADGIVPGNDLNSNNLDMRMTSKISKRLTVDTKLNYIRQDFSNVLFTGINFNNPLFYLYQIPRNIRTEDIAHYEFLNDEGQLTQHFYSPGFNGAGNPYWVRNNVQQPSVVERVLGMVSLNYSIIDNLSIQVRSALDRSNSMTENKFYNDTYVTGTNGFYSRLNSNSYEWNTDVLVNYHKKILTNFNLSISAGANDRDHEEDALGASGSNFQIQNLFALSNTTNPVPIDNSFLHKEVHSAYGFGEFSYKNAIFLNVTGRNDWSSTLPANSRSYFYPSIGLSAVLSDLMKFPKFFTFVKVRGSYAEVGNDTDPYNLFRTVSIANGTIALSPIELNPNLKPESTHSDEIGVDLRMLKNKIRFNFTYYKENTFDQLFASPVPVGSGVSSIFQNGGNIQNSGIEINLDASIVSNTAFKWDIGVNFSRNRNKVLEIAKGFDQLSQGADYIRVYKLVAGQPYGDVYSRGYVRDGQGRVIVDSDGLPEVTVGQDVKVANYNPDWLAGITNTFNYKNFTLSALIDIRQGGTFISNTEANLAGDGVLDYTAKGRDGNLIFGDNVFGNEKAVAADGSVNKYSTTAEALWNYLGGLGTPIGESFIRSASNVRLREVILGYSLKEQMLSKLPFNSVRFSLVGRNLFFFSNSGKYVDPENVEDVSNTSEGRENFALPTARTFGISIQLGF